MVMMQGTFNDLDDFATPEERYKYSLSQRIEAKAREKGTEFDLLWDRLENEYPEAIIIIEEARELKRAVKECEAAHKEINGYEMKLYTFKKRD